MTYQNIIQRLRAVYDDGEARALARLMLGEAFGLSLTDIMCDKVSCLSQEDNERLEEIMLRLENHEPLQYILGYEDFCGHRFTVRQGVLIPRPETEELVQLIADSEVAERGRILDIGTGSGCIAISLALAHPEAEVTAWDISEDAISIAKQNAERLGARVNVERMDILDAENLPQTNGEFDIIVSNPPYICQREADEMDQNVLDYEPHLALFVPDNDPLLFYRAIALYGRRALRQGGNLWFEINRAYGNEVCEMLSEAGYGGVRVINDQFGNARMVVGYQLSVISY